VAAAAAADKFEQFKTIDCRLPNYRGGNYCCVWCEKFDGCEIEIFRFFPSNNELNNY
jgi:hypothetical protein